MKLNFENIVLTLAGYLLFAMCVIATLLAVILFDTSANAQATAPVKLIFLNECADLPPEAFKKATNLAEWEALTVMWECFNRTQASQSSVTLRQIKTAIKNTGFKKKLTIYSVDPKCTEDECTFGAWLRHGKLTYADMPGCPNARKVLERLLRKLK